jgi:TfoX/Sxy family transcriptional regulator of competence genes
MASDRKTLERVRKILSHRQVVEKPMVGGSRGMMVDGKLCVSVGVGRILVRVDKEARPSLLKKPGTSPMKMDGKTLMGFIFIDASGYRTDTQLKAWILQSLDVISAAPVKNKAGTLVKK